MAASATSEAVTAAASPLPCSLGCHFLHGRRALELGSGDGLLGLLLVHFAAQVALTDHKGRGDRPAERNTDLARERHDAAAAAVGGAVPSLPEAASVAPSAHT